MSAPPPPSLPPLLATPGSSCAYHSPQSRGETQRLFNALTRERQKLGLPPSLPLRLKKFLCSCPHNLPFHTSLPRLPEEHPGLKAAESFCVSELGLDAAFYKSKIAPSRELVRVLARLAQHEYSFFLPEEEKHKPALPCVLSTTFNLEIPGTHLGLALGKKGVHVLRMKEKHNVEIVFGGVLPPHRLTRAQMIEFKVKQRYTKFTTVTISCPTSKDGVARIYRAYREIQEHIAEAIKKKEAFTKARQEFYARRAASRALNYNTPAVVSLPELTPKQINQEIYQTTTSISKGKSKNSNGKLKNHLKALKLQEPMHCINCFAERTDGNIKQSCVYHAGYELKDSPVRTWSCCGHQVHADADEAMKDGCASHPMHIWHSSVHGHNSNGLKSSKSKGQGRGKASHLL